MLHACLLPFDTAGDLVADVMGRQAREWVNCLYAFWNFVEMGCPADGGKYWPGSDFLCARTAERAAVKLLPEVRDLIGESGDLFKESCTGRRCELLHELGALRVHAYGQGRPRLHAEVGAGTGVRAHPVPRDVAVPSVPGSIDPGAWLSPERRRQLHDLERLPLDGAAAEDERRERRLPHLLL